MKNVKYKKNFISPICCIISSGGLDFGPYISYIKIYGEKNGMNIMI